MYLYWLPSLLLVTSISAKAAFMPRNPLPTSTGTPVYPSASFPLYTTGTGTGVYSTGTGTGYTYPTFTTVTPTTSYTYTPPPPPPPSSTTSLPPAKPSTFKIQIIVEYNPGTTVPAINNSYAFVRPIRPGEDGYTQDDGVDSMFTTPSFALASIFHLNADHTLSYFGLGGNEYAVNNLDAPGDPGGAYKFYLFENQAKINAGNKAAGDGSIVKSVCSISNGYLTCRTGINYLDFTCSDQIESGPTERSYEDFCYPLGLKTIPIL